MQRVRLVEERNGIEPLRPMFGSRTEEPSHPILIREYSIYIRDGSIPKKIDRMEPSHFDGARCRHAAERSERTPRASRYSERRLAVAEQKRGRRRERAAAAALVPAAAAAALARTRRGERAGAGQRRRAHAAAAVSGFFYFNTNF